MKMQNLETNTLMNTTSALGISALVLVGFAACGDDDEPNPTIDGGRDAVVGDADIVDPDAVVPDAEVLDADIIDPDAVVPDADVVDADFFDAGELGDFTLNLSEFGPHVGQKLVVTVVEENGDMAVGAHVRAEAAADMTVTIPGIIEAGKEYVINFYADLDGDEECDAPPTDHVWSITDQVPTGNTLEVNFTHETTFTDVCNDIVESI